MEPAVEPLSAGPPPHLVKKPPDERLAELDRLERALAQARRVRADAADDARAEPRAAAAASAPADPEPAHPEPAARPRRMLAPAAVETDETGAYAALAPAAIVRRLARRWYLILLGGLSGAALMAAYSLTLPNEFQAISRIVLEPRGITPIRDTVAPQGLNSEATIAYSQSQVDIIRSLSVLEPVVEGEDLANDREFVDTRHWLDKLGLDGLRRLLLPAQAREPADANLLEEVNRRLYVGRLNQSFVIEIGFISEDPSKAARIANAITRSYLKSESGAQSAAAQSASTDLTNRLDALRAKVAASEDLIEAHKREHNLVETNGRLVDEDSLARFNDQLARAAAQTVEARSRVELAKDIDVEDAVGGGLPEPLQTQAMAQARLQYQRASAAVSRLSVKLGERHPQLREAAADLTAAENSVRAELKRISEATERELKRAQSREADLRESVAKLRERALESNAPKAELRELERRLDADRQVYENFLRRSRETGEQTAIASRNARVISEALPPEEKVGPPRTLMTIAGGLIGGGIGGLLAMLPILFGIGRSFLAGAPAPRRGPVRSTAQAAREPDDLYGDAPMRDAPPIETTPAEPKRVSDPAPAIETPVAAVPLQAEEVPDRPSASPGEHDAALARAWGDGVAVARREAAILDEARREAETLRAQAQAQAQASAPAAMPVQMQPPYPMAPPMMPPAYPMWPAPPMPYAYPPAPWPYPMQAPPQAAAPEPREDGKG